MRLGRPGGKRRTPTPFFLVFLGGVGAYFAQAERLPLVAVAAVALGMAPLVSLSRATHVLGLALVRPPVSTWYVGDDFPLGLVVHNRGTSTIPVMELTLTGALTVLGPYTVPELSPGERAELTHHVPLTARRGPSPVLPGWERQQRLIGAPQHVKSTVAEPLMLPAVRPMPVLPPAHVVERLSRPSDEGRGSGMRGSGDPLALRTFASGDPTSSVHWRSTARAGTPVVMEHDRPVAGLLVLLVASSDQGPSWEAGVARAAGLVQVAAALAVPVEVVVAAPVQPLPGPGHESVQDWLAALDVAGPADGAMVTRAVRLASGGLVAVLSADPSLAGRLLASAAPHSVVDLMTETW
ncbi:hypothetical protein acdb102_43900 [Acidothermaceae bacterium B102]|nr:hypothetical protein acdb102_43900 [Acidothermaceae bacterium B102]